MTIIVWKSILEEQTLKYKIEKYVTGLGTMVGGIITVCSLCNYMASTFELNDGNPKTAVVATASGLISAALFYNSFVKASDKFHAVNELQIQINEGNIPLNVQNERELNKHIDSLAIQRKEDRKILSRTFRRYKE